jgi:hypothetical protein
MSISEIENRFQLIREELMDEYDDPECDDEDDLNRESEKVYKERFGIDYHDDLEKAFVQFLIDEGYFELRHIDGVGWCGLYRFAFTVGLVTGMNEYGYVGRYCYENLSDAKEALKEWNGKNDPSGPWIKYKGEGGERVNENYIK